MLTNQVIILIVVTLSAILLSGLGLFGGAEKNGANNIYPFHGDIEQLTVENQNYRQVLSVQKNKPEGKEHDH